ncbi:uncharacterized protein LOC107621492 isoform X2 [Arachis ipaensis]|uniref:uncharacterized protein LOC107621492 isoform X2 n=1 Tax=Arachis ipaensis TaxID=130454 RepID=UPI000A2B043F|nr:uncharacterized protein LOC107621492 isoform X2 [Arachis ipaensis]
MGGDFNEILEVEDRFGCNTLTQNSLLFREWVEAMELLELELRDRKYTWYGGRSCRRIDRVFIHVELQECFDIVRLKMLSRSLSDHCLLLVDSGVVDWGPKPFRTIDAWLTHAGFKETVRKEWEKSRERNLLEKLDLLKRPLRVWNKEKFGSINCQIEKIESEIQSVDKCFAEGIQDECLLARNKALKILLEKWYERKDDYWRQMSRSRYATPLDRNTKYFHAVTKVKRRGKVMNSVCIDGEYIREPCTVKREIRRYFENLYREDKHLSIGFDMSLVKRISSEDSIFLERKPKREEIKGAVWECELSRAPGPDGFNFKSIRNLWDIIGEDFSQVVEDFF